MHIEAEAPRVYGLVAEFSDADAIVLAATRAREAGYRRMDAYTPFPVHHLAEAIGFHDSRVPWVIFIGGVLGAIGGFGLQSWINYIDYPMNVGGRPYIPWPSFIPVTFECTVLIASFAAVFGTLGMCGLPRPHHSIFNTPNFDRASQDKFFLCIEAADPKFDAKQTAAFLTGLGADAVEEVAR